MAKPEQIAILKKGVSAWNEWMEKESPYPSKIIREESKKPNSTISKRNLSNYRRCDLQGANLRSMRHLNGINFHRADLRDTDLSGVDLSGAYMRKAYLDRGNFKNTIFDNSNLELARFIGADLKKASFIGANMLEANLCDTDLYETNMSNAQLSGAWLRHSKLIRTNFSGSNLNGALVYGISAWDINLKGAQQKDLLITPKKQSEITIDNLEVAQFIYLLLNNNRIRNVIDTVTSKLVLILGRFSDQHMPILNAIRNELRLKNYLPALFTFSKPDSRDYIETVLTLAHIARFVIADFSEPKIILEEATHIVRNVSIPFVPIIGNDAGREPTTLYNLKINHRSITDTYRYENMDELIENFDEKIIKRAEIKFNELQSYRNKFT